MYVSTTTYHDELLLLFLLLQTEQRKVYILKTERYIARSMCMHIIDIYTL